MKKLVLGALVSLCLITPAMASDWAVWGHVTVISMSSMPTALVIQTDVPAGTCAAGAWLTYNAEGSNSTNQLANIQAVYAALLAATASGHHVELIGNNSGCVITGVWITQT